jgi:PIN domain nuclease of toxin-antitoxin system
VKRYLLDTHLIYWWMTADARLGKATQRIIAKSEIVVSTASVWEMVLKNANGKLPLPQGTIAEQLEAQGFILLPILPRHIEAVRVLTCAHSDPFDRLLIAQAQDERLTLLTRDASILELGLNGVVKG